MSSVVPAEVRPAVTYTEAADSRTTGIVGPRWAGLLAPTSITTGPRCHRRNADHQGPLTGITYTDADSAARAVATTYRPFAPADDGDDAVALALVPTCRRVIPRNGCER
ncbi:hypothetical protein ACWEKR_02280 [Nocardia sp. NPDC004573]